METPIAPNETSGELFERLSAMGGDILRRDLLPWLDGQRPALPQEGAATYARRPCMKRRAGFTRGPVRRQR